MLTLDKKNKTVLCLGFFDSLHFGHQKVIERAKLLAEKNGSSITVFSFNGNLKKALFGENEKVVLLPSERKRVLKSMGIKSTYFMPVTKKYLSLGKKEFLDLLTQKFSVSAFVFGEDFRFGKNAEGNASYALDYAREKNISVEIVPLENYNGEKISTTRVKDLLALGKIDLANELLGREYFISGKVFKDRGVGTKMGFPTANVDFSTDKATLKTGVYKGRVRLKNKTYSALINYGYRPTFNQNTLTLEVYLVNFNGNLYGRTITVFFEEFIREEKKFSNDKELVAQIEKDLKRVKTND